MKSCELHASRLVLENGVFLDGLSPNWLQGSFGGEVVFHTGMTGYCEALTDPSYAGQILVFTYPLIGNYGVPEKSFWESDKIQVSGAVFAELCGSHHHHASVESLESWLARGRIPYITGIDTRRLVQVLRGGEAHFGMIKTDNSLSRDGTLESLGLNDHEVSIKDKIIHPSSSKTAKKVICVDCGIKKSILHRLRDMPIELIQVPANYDYSGEMFDGVFLSNGPGNPESYSATLSILKKVLRMKKPLFGICLGAQLMALAAGGNTYRMRFGHRGVNHPCMDLESGRCFITSQNHGYAIQADTLSSEWGVSHVNLNDGSVEGIAHQTLPFFGVQFHPEGSPGPKESNFLFDRFYRSICLNGD